MLVSDVIGMVQLAFVNEIKLRDISLGRESYSRIPILPSLSMTIHLTLAAVVISREVNFISKVLPNESTLVSIQRYRLDECSINVAPGWNTDDNYG